MGRRPFKSRLLIYWPSVTVNVVKLTPASGQNTDTTLYTGIAATHRQDSREIKAGELGLIIVDLDIFSFNQETLPTILPGYIIIYNTDRYQVKAALREGAANEQLEVITEKI